MCLSIKDQTHCRGEDGKILRPSRQALATRLSVSDRTPERGDVLIMLLKGGGELMVSASIRYKIKVVGLRRMDCSFQ